MRTVLLTGVGALGSAALELLARSPSVDRIVTVKRSTAPGATAGTLAALGAVFQGYAKQFAHHQLDIAETDRLASVIAAEKPDVILHSATLQSPRALMKAKVDPSVRATLRAATFSMWLPWHLLPATWLVEAVIASGVHCSIVNASFPDVVNAAATARFGVGPVAGVGNVEVAASQVQRYAVDELGLPFDDIELWLVGSHAFFVHGPAVPHHLHLSARGEDITDQVDVAAATAHPEPIDWSAISDFFVFGASAAKNVEALLSDGPLRTHVSGASGHLGGYPAHIGAGRVEIDPPPGLSLDDTLAINRDAARWDGIESIEPDGTVVYTSEAAGAMEELGYGFARVTPEDLQEQADQLMSLYRRLVTTTESPDA